MYTTPYIRNTFHRTVKSLATLRALIAGAVQTFVQTYATASLTVAADTSHAITDSGGGTPSTTALALQTLPTALTDNGAGTADGTVEAMPNPTDTPATADALRDDIVAVLLPTIRNNFKEVTTTLVAVRAQLAVLKDTCSTLAAELALAKADALNTKKNVNALIDSLQTAGQAA